jgi:hypothetical protein
MILGTTISDITSCHIRTPDITSDIDSDIGGVVLWYHWLWTVISQPLWYHSQYRRSGTVISELGWCDIGAWVPDIGDSDSDIGFLWVAVTVISGKPRYQELWYWVKLRYHSWQESRWKSRNIIKYTGIGCSCKTKYVFWQIIFYFRQWHKKISN